jgi:hypothetical protein
MQDELTIRDGAFPVLLGKAIPGEQLLPVVNSRLGSKDTAAGRVTKR